MKYTYRRYTSGDEDVINDLYRQVTGRQRNHEAFTWQWLETPAGESEIWLIEAHLSDGTTKLIGHHGVMALAFSHFGVPLRAGKTENTMVLPEYREKILYPRYEQRFFAEYESKFHVLFSTSGPREAIRVREAMGYEYKHDWKTLHFASEPVLSARLLASELAQRWFETDTYLGNCVFPDEIMIQGTRVHCFFRRDPAPFFDFDGFWQQAGSHYPCTPTRTASYLGWRFWRSPYTRHITLILDDEKLDVAVCILSMNRFGILAIDDIYCGVPDNLPRFIEKVHNWAGQVFPFFVLRFSTTSDTTELFAASRRLRDTTLLNKLAARTKPRERRLMPRKVTRLGRSMEAPPDGNWYVTPIVFER